MSVACQEALAANALRRAVRTGDSVAVPRVSDLDALPAAMAGKVEVDSLDEDRDGEILTRIVQAAVLSVFRDLVPGALHRGVVEAFDTHEGVSTGDDLGASTYAEVTTEIPALSTAVVAVLGDESDKTDKPVAGMDTALLASAVELVLEGLHLSRRLNKQVSGPQSRYSSREMESGSSSGGLAGS